MKNEPEIIRYEEPAKPNYYFRDESYCDLCCKSLEDAKTLVMFPSCGKGASMICEDCLRLSLKMVTVKNLTSEKK